MQMANLHTNLDIVALLYKDMTNYSTMIYQVINSIYYRSYECFVELFIYLYFNYLFINYYFYVDVRLFDLESVVFLCGMEYSIL